MSRAVRIAARWYSSQSTTQTVATGTSTPVTPWPRHACPTARVVYARGVEESLRRLWDFADAAGSEARFRQAARQAAAPGIAMTQVARALGLQRRFDEANAVLDGLPQTDPEVVVRIGLERGRIARDCGQPDVAREHFESAIARARSNGLDEPLVDGLHMLALVSDGSERDDLHHQALELAHASGDPAARRWEASILNNMGVDRADAGDFAGALELFEAALAARPTDGSDLSRVGVARWMVAWALRNLGRTAEALEWQRDLKADLLAGGLSDPYVDEEIAILESNGSPS